MVLGREEVRMMPRIAPEASLVDLRECSRRADTLYEEMRGRLEREHPGEIVAIEPDSGEYFVGKDRREVEKKARAKYPDKIFFRRRIGASPAVIHLPGRVRPVGLL
jgi:hypothetical protein